MEVQIDNGQWHRAALASANTKYSWKLFALPLGRCDAGEHTLVSRVTDVNDAVQPVAADLARKKTFLEDNAQFPREVVIS